MLARALETPEKQKKRFSRKKKSQKNSKDGAGGPSSTRKKKDINGIPRDTEALIECGRSDIEMKEVLVNAEVRWSAGC